MTNQDNPMSSFPSYEGPSEHSTHASRGDVRPPAPKFKEGASRHSKKYEDVARSKHPVEDVEKEDSPYEPKRKDTKGVNQKDTDKETKAGESKKEDVLATDDESSRRIQVENSLVVQVFLWHDWLDHVLHQVLFDLVIGHILIVLG